MDGAITNPAATQPMNSNQHAGHAAVAAPKGQGVQGRKDKDIEGKGQGQGNEQGGEGKVARRLTTPQGSLINTQPSTYDEASKTLSDLTETMQQAAKDRAVENKEGLNQQQYSDQIQENNTYSNLVDSLSNEISNLRAINPNDPKLGPLMAKLSYAQRVLGNLVATTEDQTPTQQTAATQHPNYASSVGESGHYYSPGKTTGTKYAYTNPNQPALDPPTSPNNPGAVSKEQSKNLFLVGNSFVAYFKAMLAYTLTLIQVELMENKQMVESMTQLYEMAQGAAAATIASGQLQANIMASQAYGQIAGGGCFIYWSGLDVLFTAR